MRIEPKQYMTQDKAEEIRMNLSQLYHEGDTYRGSGWGLKKMKRAFSFFNAFIDEKQNPSVLDLGCGGMTLAMYMQDSFPYRIIGVDLVHELLAKLSSRRAPGIPLINGDIEALPFKTDTFDIVVHNQVLHHFSSLHLVLPEVKRVLRPGGYLWSIETNGWNPYVHCHHYWPASKRKNFICDNEIPFGLLQFKKDLRTAGFKIIDAKMVNFDFVKYLSPFDGLFGAIPLFNLVFGGSMLVCSRKPFLGEKVRA